MRHLIVAAMVAVAFGMAAGPVQAHGDEVASAQAQGACYDEDYDADGDGSADDTDDPHGAEDSAVVKVTEGPDAHVFAPDEGNVEQGLNACANSAQDGETPDGGSHATVTVTVDGQSESVSTVAVTDQLP